MHKQLYEHLFMLLIVLGLLFECKSGQLPPDIQKCKVNDNVCVANKIRELFQKFPNGNPQFGMPNVSAINLTNVTVSRAKSDSPIQLNFKFLKLTCYGLENSIIVNTTGWSKEPKIIDGEIYVPLMKIVGDYETNGKILLLSLDGKGKGTFEMTDCIFHMKGRLSFEKRKDGKNYAKLEKLKVDMKPKKFFVNMENLVRGSQVLTDTLNKVLNDNWRDVWNEMSDGINTALASVYTNITSGVLNELSYDDFYAE
uniref:Hemolymph juvenile hormone binding protein n=1 Tax=Stomoxys calcitrans TaxID=35570 RepID=A0A1I8Q3X1_STOCA|nr:unnamed protein product [Stomoxys calcitrans]